MSGTFGSIKGIDSYYRAQWPSGWINWHNHLHSNSTNQEGGNLNSPTWIRYETNKWYMFSSTNAQGTNGEQMNSLYRHFNPTSENHIITGSSSPPGGYVANGLLGIVYKNNGVNRVPIYRFRKEYFTTTSYGAAQKNNTVTTSGVVKRIKLRATNSTNLQGGTIWCPYNVSGVYCAVINGADTNTSSNSSGCIDPTTGSGYRNFSWSNISGGSGSGLLTHMRILPELGSSGNPNNLRVQYPGTWYNSGGGDFGEGGVYFSGGSGYAVGDVLRPITTCGSFDTNASNLFEVTEVGSYNTTTTEQINRIDHRTSTDRIDTLNDGWIYEGIQGYAPLRRGGCTDSSANNYDAYATEDNGTCSYTVYGCTDSNADNYDSNADEDDGSCTYTPEFEWGFRIASTAPSGGFSNNVIADEGMTFQIRLKWSKANDIKNTGFRVGYDFDENDLISTASLSDFNGGTSNEYAITTNSGSKLYNVTASEDISVGEGNEVMRVDFFTKTSANSAKWFRAGRTITINDSSFQILGCTDSTAFNYNSSANTDDGSCVPFIYGCTDPEGYNYNSDANTDDGSCFYAPVLQSAELDPTNIILQGGSTSDASVSSTLKVRWLGNRNNYTTGDNGTSDFIKIYRQTTQGYGFEGHTFVRDSSSSEITYIGPGPAPGYQGLYEFSGTVTLERDYRSDTDVVTKVPHEFSITTHFYNDDTSSFEEGDRDFVFPGTGTYFWHKPDGVTYTDPQIGYDYQQIASFKDRETRTLVFKYVGFNTFNTINVYWDIVGVGGLVTAAQAFETTSGVVSTSLDNDSYNYQVGTLSIPLTALAPATTSPTSYQLTLRLNNSNGVIAWQQTFQLTEPSPVMLTPSFTNSNGDVITTVPLKNQYVADHPFYHVIANWSYDTISGGLPSSQQYQIVKVSGWSGTSGTIPVDDRVFTFDDNASGSGLLRETYTSPALTLPGDTIRFIVRGINDGGSSGTFGDLVAYDPVVINSYGYSQTTINNAVAYTSTGTPTLRAAVGQVITLEFNVQYLSQYVIQRKFENDVVDLTTVGDRTANDFSSPSSFSGTLDITQESLPIGASELILKIYGHANDVRTEKVIVESYIPVTLTTTVTDSNISVGDSTTINLQFGGSTDGDIIMMPGNISIPIPETGNTIPVVVTPDITTNYKFTLNGLGGDTTVAYRTINTSLPPQIDYFAPTQNPIQKGDSYGIYWGVSGNYQSIEINGVSMTGNSGTYTQAAPNVDDDITHVITVVGILGQTIQESFTVTIKDIFYGSDTEGAENILFNEIVRGGDLDPATTPQTIVIPFNNLNTVISVCSAAGGDGAPSGSSPTTTGGAGGKGFGATFDWPDFNSSSLQVNPGQKGQTRTTSCTSCSSNGGLGLYGGAPSGTVASGGSGGGGGAATGVYEGDNQTVIIEAGGGGGGGGASLGGYSGLSGQRSIGWNATTGNIGHSVGAIGGNANPSGGGSGGGDGGGGTSSTSTPSLTPSSGGYDNNTAAEGGEGGLSIYRNDLVTLRANIPGFPTTNLSPLSTYGDGWVWVQYVTGVPKIVSFTVTPVDNVGSNIFDISWETEGMLNVVVRQDEANITVDDQNLSGEYIGWSSNLVSIAGVVSPATDSFTITANGYDSNVYTQTINVTVVNDSTPDTDNWQTTNETNPSIQIEQNLGNLISELPVTLYNQPLSGVTLGPSNNGPWSNEYTFQPGQVVWIRYFSLPFNTDVTDQTTGELLTGLYGNTNDKPIEIYAGGRWFPELEGTSIVVSGAGPYGEAGKGELGGFVAPGETRGILLMGSYGDTEHTPVRTATWSKNTTNVNEIRINHISGNGSNGGESPNDENEVLELVIDPNDGTTPRVVEIVPKRSSVTKPATSRYFISGNVPQYYPCAGRPGATLTAISYNSDRSVVFCWYSETYQVNDYDQQYGNWKQTGVPLLSNEKVSNCTFTLRSYGSNPEFSNAIPSSIAANNKNAGDLFAINQIIYVESNGNTSSDQPGTFRVDFLAKTRPPVIHEDFDYVGTVNVDAFPDIDFNDQNSVEYMLSNSIQVDDIELFRSDQALEIRSDDPNVQVKINSLPWQNVREIEE